MSDRGTDILGIGSPPHSYDGRLVIPAWRTNGKGLAFMGRKLSGPP
jgi:hypothetical protein